MQICCLKQKNTHVCGCVYGCVCVRVCAHFSLMKVPAGHFDKDNLSTCQLALSRARGRRVRGRGSGDSFVD